MKPDSVKMQPQVFSARSAHMETNSTMKILSVVFTFLLLLTAAGLPAGAQQKAKNAKAAPTPKTGTKTSASSDCTPNRDLIEIPEIVGDGKFLRGTITLSDETRNFWGTAKGTPCVPQDMRFFKGTTTKPWPSTGDPLPGPTLRGHVGETVEITFINRIDPMNFAATLDQEEQGKTSGCDVATATRRNPGNPPTQQIYPRNDVMPNCLHGSTTSNLHFHGTHTSPATTGDNIFLFIRPSLRDSSGNFEPSDADIKTNFEKFFADCEKNGPPTMWTQMPQTWQDKQKELLTKYDQSSGQHLWKSNEDKIKKDQWPQYNIGAYPYCFHLPAYDPAKVKMGQAPGTHWYHAHKHGSTALNVSNGMSGVFIIEGEYDKVLRDFYKATPEHKNWGLQEQVLVIQQLETALKLMSPGPPTGAAALSINGILNPVVHMRPGQVQMWRIVNSAARSFAEFTKFVPISSSPGCKLPTPPASHTIHWRQTAQDGVQFKWNNYQHVGAIDHKFNMATGNRVDLLVEAPGNEGCYALQYVDSVVQNPTGTPATLLTVEVKADPAKLISPPMPFISKPEDFPPFPPFLEDLPPREALMHQTTLTFDTTPSAGRAGKGTLPLHTINGKLFDGKVNQSVAMNEIEEWTMVNDTVGIAHPFHIHVNPFQVVEVFSPTDASASDPQSRCYADPTNPATWKACQGSYGGKDFVWWDVLAIPDARQDTMVCSQNTCPNSEGTACADTQVCTVTYPGNPAKTRTLACTQNNGQNTCPNPPGTTATACSSQSACTVNIPGYFKMRSRFADFPGQFVLHCHILAHEDRGMMQTVEIRGLNSSYEHH